MQAVSQTWLDFQCKLMPGINRAVLMLAEPETDNYRVVAHWPENFTDSDQFSKAGEMALDKQRLVFQAAEVSNEQSEQGLLIVAYPLMFDERIAGVVALEMPRRSPQEMLSVQKVLAWGASWLDYLLQQEQDLPAKTPLVTVLQEIIQPA